MSANPIKWSNTLKQFVGFCQRIVWVCLIILWGWCLFKVNSRSTRKRCKICSKLIIKAPERRRRSGVFIVNFEHISHLFLVFLFLALNWSMLAGELSIITACFLKPVSRGIVNYHSLFFKTCKVENASFFLTSSNVAWVLILKIIIIDHHSFVECLNRPL